MIKVKLTTNTMKVESIVSPETIIKDFLDEQEVPSDTGQFSLNGKTLDDYDLNMSFSEHGADESCILTKVRKTENKA